MRTTSKALALVAVVLAGCQLFVSSDVVQCATDGDCAPRGGEFEDTVCVDSLCVAPGDRCIGHVTEALEDRTKPLHLRFRYADVGGNPLKNVEVLVCAALDEACGSPVGAPVLTDVNGYAWLTIWRNFRGTIQVKRPPSPDFLKSKVHFLSPIENDDRPDRVIPIEESVRLLTKALFALQLGTRGNLDPNAGHVIAQVADCDLRPRGGAAITPTTPGPNASILFYFTDNGLVSSDATETGANGRFGIVNVPEGPLDLDAVLTKTGKRLGHVSIFVNKETLSNFAIAPTP